MNKDNPNITIEDIINDVKRYLTDEEITKLKEAYKYASIVKKKKKRLSGDDYIKHPLNVVHILSKLNADSDTLIAGMLHDTISVGGIKASDIESRFGIDVASLVKGVTKINRLHYNGSNETTISNHRKILVGLTKDVRVIFIKLADRLHNMRTMYMLSDEKKKLNASETLEILTPIAHRLGINQIKSELEDLSLRYLKPDVYFSIVERLNKSKNERNKFVDEMMDNVSKLLNEHGIKHEIKGRAKSIYSIYKKLDKGKRFSDIYDLLALRVFVKDVSDCYQAMGLIHSKYRPVPKRFKDYIAMPKSNMYQSLHTTVFGPEGNFFEIQIRTYEMDEIAERGIASHWSYKEQGKNLMKGMEEKLQFFRSIMEIKESAEDIDTKMEELKDTVYVYTPKGDVIELPYGSTPIDFAYRVHSKVGDSMVGAIVNENIVPLDYVLQDNDVIKINTSNNSNGPSKSWLDIVYTSQAKNKIRSFFNKIDKKEYLKKGEEVLAKELRKKKIPTSDLLTGDNLKKVLDDLHLANINDLYINVGSGKISASQVINTTNDNDKNKEETLLNKVMNTNLEKESKGDIIVDGIDDIKINVAKCCRPVPGDDIVGYIQTGIGINIHKSTCPNVSSVSERLINVRWNDDIEKRYATNIIVYTNTNKDLVLTIASITQSNNLSIKSMNTIKSDGKYTFEIKVAVNNLEKVKKYMNDIEALDEVTGVERVIR